MVTLRINGGERRFDGDPDMPLLWYLRDTLALTGTKYGCGQALCGACTVHLDGEAVRGCGIAMRDLEGRRVTTIEGLDPAGNHVVQRAWRALDVPQCGYCQAGQIMQAAALLATTRTPTDAQIDEAMAGNICRCGTYQRIRAAIHMAAKGEV
jgi:isoquinoline 1-oxidoreductase subunit alpha